MSRVREDLSKGIVGHRKPRAETARSEAGELSGAAQEAHGRR